ncbi:MAG: hypothetical protein ACI8QS_002179 [Planctomycetota bacterium]|jgi:hypothetical protein
MHTIILLVPTLLCFTSAALGAPTAQDWPGFLGPHGDSSVDWAEADFAWPKGGPEVIWKLETGPGYGGAAVHGGEVFLMDRIDGEADVLRVYNLATGKHLWEAAYPARGRLNYQGSRTVPVVNDTHVFAAGGHGQVTAFDRKEQAIAWSMNVADDLGGMQPMFGFSSNPLLFGDTLIVAVLGEYVGLAGVDVNTGETRWESEPVGFSHSSPVLMQVAGETQVVFSSCPTPGSGRDRAAPSWISGFDPVAGDLLWRHELPLSGLPVPPPVQVDAERFFFTGGYRAGSTMTRITKEKGDYVFEELFHIDRGSQIHRPIFFEEHIYVIVNENWNRSRRRQKEGGLLCLNLSGEEVWRTGEDPFFSLGGFSRIGNTLLVQDGDDGHLEAVLADPAGFKSVGTFDTFGLATGEESMDEQTWAPLAFSGDFLITRSQRELVCVRLRGDS